MKCIQCGAEVNELNGDGEAYCPKCMKERRIKNPKCYSCALGGYIEERF
jgi:DNA-directed RNA polymerase subunit RPC12/RpoP